MIIGYRDVDTISSKFYKTLNLKVYNRFVPYHGNKQSCNVSLELFFCNMLPARSILILLPGTRNGLATTLSKINEASHNYKESYIYDTPCVTQGI